MFQHHVIVPVRMYVGCAINLGHIWLKQRPFKTKERFKIQIISAICFTSLRSNNCSNTSEEAVKRNVKQKGTAKDNRLWEGGEWVRTSYTSFVSEENVYVTKP